LNANLYSFLGENVLVFKMAADPDSPLAPRVARLCPGGIGTAHDVVLKLQGRTGVHYYLHDINVDMREPKTKGSPLTS
jgi:hypothetical protein